MKAQPPRFAVAHGLLGLAALLGTCALGVSGVAHAEAPDGAPTEAADESRAQAFQAVEGAIEEDVPGGPLLVAAYGVIWLVVFGYAYRLVSLQRRTLEDIGELRSLIAASAAPAKGADDVAPE